MKFVELLIVLCVLGGASASQASSAVSAVIPCKLKIDANFKKLSDRAIDAVEAGIDEYQPYAPHVEIGTEFPASSDNIRWKIKVAEAHYNFSKEQGHLVQAKVAFYNRNEVNETDIVYYSSPESYEAAVKGIVGKVLYRSGVEQVAVSEGGCPPVQKSQNAAYRGPSSIAVPAVTHIRAMSANISSGNQQSYDNGEGLRIFQGLKPDVVMIQEFNYKSNSEKDLSEMIMTAFDKAFSFYRESESSDQIPNGIISRFPILKSGEWEDQGMPNRDFAWAQMDIPGDRELWAISVHLSASKPHVRKQEAEALKTLIRENIPADDYVLLGGDFNITKRDEAPIQILSEVVFERHAPSDSNGRTTTNMTNKKNYDWVLSNENLAKYQVPTSFRSNAEEVEVELENVFPHGLVFDSATFPRLDRVAPILQEDSRAPGMQHLAVVKDFDVPAPVDGDGDEEEESLQERFQRNGCEDVN